MKIGFVAKKKMKPHPGSSACTKAITTRMWIYWNKKKTSYLLTNRYYTCVFSGSFIMVI